MAGYPTGTPVLNIVTVAQNPANLQSSDGSVQALAGGHQSEVFVRELGGKRYAAASRGNLYHGCTGAITMTVYSSTAATAMLYNPAGSGRLLEVHKIRVTQILATDVLDGLVLGVRTGVGSGATALPTAVTNGTVTNMPIGGPAISPIGQFYNVATIVAPTLLQGLGFFLASTTSTENLSGPAEVDFDGTLVLAPATYIVVGTSTTIQGGANLIVDVVWSEWLP